MIFTPNRIVLIGAAGRHDEAPADANVYPGMLAAPQSDGGVKAHATAGGGGPLIVIKEDALQGKDATQVLTSGNVVPFWRAGKGDKLLMLLQNGQNVAAAAGLMSAGDGTLIAALTNPVYEIVAASATVTNTTAETTFSNGSYTFPANVLVAGDVINYRGTVTVVAQNSTDTEQVKVYLGSDVILNTGALNLATAQVVEFSLNCTILAIGNSGTVEVSGWFASGAAGATVKEQIIASTALNTTPATIAKVTVQASAANVGDQVQLTEFRLELMRIGGITSLVVADEAIDNSAGAGSSPVSGFNTAAFIRVIVP